MQLSRKCNPKPQGDSLLHLLKQAEMHGREHPVRTGRDAPGCAAGTRHGWHSLDVSPGVRPQGTLPHTRTCRAQAEAGPSATAAMSHMPTGCWGRLATLFPFCSRLIFKPHYQSNDIIFLNFKVRHIFPL